MVRSGRPVRGWRTIDMPRTASFSVFSMDRFRMDPLLGNTVDDAGDEAAGGIVVPRGLNARISGGRHGDAVQLDYGLLGQINRGDRQILAQVGERRGSGDQQDVGRAPQ